MSSQAPQIERRESQTRIENVLDHSRFADRWIARVVRSLKIGHLIIETPSGARVEAGAKSKVRARRSISIAGEPCGA
jgi:hypothetical protein